MSLDILYDCDMNIASWIRAARAHSKKTQEELASVLGLTKGNISAWENGRHEPSINQLAKISTFTGYKLPSELVGMAGGSNVVAGPDIRGKLPLISWVKAGDLCESPDNFQPGYAEDWIDCPVPHSPRSYCLRVSGDSMDGEGGYRDGEIIFVDPEVAATPGRDVVVRTPDGKMTFKRLKEDTEGQYLLGLNGKKIIRIPPGTHICGVVIFSGFKR